MLWNLQSDSLMMVIVMVAMPAFLFGLILDAVMKSDGFGALGNMVVLTTGFFLGILSFNHYGFRFDDVTFATATGLFGAFTAIFALALIKASLLRFLLR